MMYMIHRLAVEQRLRFIVSAALLLGISFSEAAESPSHRSEKPSTGTIIGSVHSQWVKCDSTVVVYVDSVKGDFKPDTTKPTMDQINRVYVPHLLPILVGTTVRFLNSDSLDHNVFSPSKLKPFNIGTWGYGGTKDYTFEKTGVVLLLCNIHYEMSAVIVILQNPFFATAGVEGRYLICDVPPGKYTLKAYHEKLNETSKTVEVTAGDTTVVNFELTL